MSLISHTLYSIPIRIARDIKIVVFDASYNTVLLKRLYYANFAQV